MSDRQTKRRSRPKLVRLKPPKGDAAMANTLLWMLKYVRESKVKAFSICMIGEREDGTEWSFESATADGDSLKELQLLGCMRAAEQGLFRRREERLEAEA